jgi:superfamily II DNA or RNA helicase
MSDWDDMQRDGVDRLIDRAQSKLAVVGSSPTGSGKTTMAAMCVQDWCVPSNLSWEFMTNRRTLLDQTVDAFRQFREKGLEFGVRGAGYRPNLERRGQVTIVQTDAKAVKEKRWEPHQADVLIIDEVHNNMPEYLQWRVQRQLDRGYPVIGLSATPIGLGRWFRHLEPLCTLSMLREVKGALIAECHTPNELDLKHIRRVKYGEKKDEMARLFTQQQVVGSIIDTWRALNPKALPTILFAPCVESSKWFCEEFNRQGIPAAHIDGGNIYYGRKKDGEREYIPSTRASRKELKKQVRQGHIKVVTNRFVMREGVDWPFLYHAIFATKMGGVVPWVQSCGRVLRADHNRPWMDHVIIQDHGGNLYGLGLGSPNADRVWELGDTAKILKDKARERLKEGLDHQPVCCPRCHRPVKWEVWTKLGNTCPYCKNKFDASERIVIQKDGRLLPVEGDAIKIRVRTDQKDMQKAWDGLFYPSSKSKGVRANTFGQLCGRLKSAHPHLQVCDDVVAIQNGVRKRVSGIRDMRSMKFYVIDNMPKPGSPVWKQEVRRTSRDILQRYEGKYGGSAGDAGSGNGEAGGGERPAEVGAAQGSNAGDGSGGNGLRSRLPDQGRGGEVPAQGGAGALRGGGNTRRRQGSLSFGNGDQGGAAHTGGAHGGDARGDGPAVGSGPAAGESAAGSGVGDGSVG